MAICRTVAEGCCTPQRSTSLKGQLRMAVDTLKGAIDPDRHGERRYPALGRSALHSWTTWTIDSKDRIYYLIWPEQRHLPDIDPKTERGVIIQGESWLSLAGIALAVMQDALRE